MVEETKAGRRPRSGPTIVFDEDTSFSVAAYPDRYLVAIRPPVGPAEIRVFPAVECFAAMDWLKSRGFPGDAPRFFREAIEDGYRRERWKV